MRIPRVVHLIWFGPPIPQVYLAEVDHLARLNPQWRIRWWRESEVARLRMVNQTLFRRASTLVPGDSVFQLQSDLARYEILHRFGGVYLDADYRWQQPLRRLFHATDTLVTSWERQGTHVANSFIAAAPGHPVLAEAIRQAPSWVQARGGRELRANRITGPGGLWTDLIRGDQHQSRTVRVLPQRLLHPVPWDHPEWAEERSYPDAVGIHLWNHQRELRGMP